MKVSTNARFCVHVMLPLLSEVGSTNADSLLHAGDGLTIQSRYTKTCNWNGADVCNSRIIHGRYVNILASV